MPDKGAGEIQRKILLLLLGGLALGLSGSPRQSFRTLDKIAEEWKWIEEQKLRRSIALLYKSKLLKEKLNKDGSVTLFLTEKGKRKALTFKIDEMEIREPKRWDRKWRVIIFDVPEIFKKKREILRFQLKRLGFQELQKSVFVHPYDCYDETEFITEFYQLRRFVRFMIAEKIDNELHLIKRFGLEI